MRHTIVVALFAMPSIAHAQHHHDLTMESEGEMEHEGVPPLGVLGIPASRHGSGTAWLPDDSPMRAIHRMVGGWAVMLHGNVFVGYDAQGSDAGDRELVSQNWIMGMAAH